MLELMTLKILTMDNFHKNYRYWNVEGKYADMIIYILKCVGEELTGESEVRIEPI